MKRALLALLAVVVAALVVLSLAGCDASVSSTGSSGSGGSGSSSAQPADKTSFNIGEGIKVDNSVLTVVSAKKFKPSNQFDKPSSGKVYFIVNLTIANGGTDAIDYNEFNYKIQDANGVQTDATILGSDVPNKMNSGSLAAGGKLNANIVFEVPKDMKGLKLVMEPNFFSKQQVLITLTK